MKIFFTIILSFIVTISAWSQDIMVKNLDKEIITGFQKTNTKTFKIQNFTNLKKSIKIKQSIENIQGGSTLLICHEENCSDNNESLIINIAPNSISSEIKLILNGGLSNLNIIAYLEFVDLEVDNIVKKELAIKVTENKPKDVFFEKGDLIVNSFFPNPAVKNAIMEYSINPNETEVKITLQNVLGSIVDTYELSPDENKLNISTENFNPGVYFYTLSIKDEGLATRKLIVKK
ncbi:T9SS type A sorting domain-containing protein [Marivirga harenae]|uniref:T9SS type A sorting domain-containing protein n=1 Tax=Marivirga harenae TaxID=2010992 RepID=UPI0026E0F368|nr:T9SS type A sorting domain-containing protein [Marivirga harenae]WKV11847.1 T9SS type A sorting domain-containing protein [Marivirga harenae]|tara:strand:+ start:25218 stop:25916 length:699 start_codon:yes stop_codon:yes gene_type:complete